MNPLKLSVIICTHNPRKDYLDRVLEALQHQTLAREYWSLLVVDNASDTPVASQWNLDWHPDSKYLHEPRPGVTYARLTGISAARYPWIVFVDDDNVLAPDYLENACLIAEKMPFLGAFSGKISGEFEIEPPEWLKADLGIIAVRDLQKDIFSSVYIWDAVPAGAGMVIKRSIAETYFEHCRGSQIRQMLNRGEDTDMVFTALDLGYAIGRFIKLEMKHLIPESRLRKQYILKLCEGNGYSEYILSLFWDNKQIATAPWHYEFALQLYRLFFESYYALQKGNRRIRGRRRAQQMLKKSGLT
ncbi:MAG: glycosyltransferase [Bacteroidota bacterium]